jgi:hypothetical protein
MPNPPAGAQTDVLLRLSLPLAGELRAIAPELATKVAEFCGASSVDAAAVAASLDRAVTGLASADGASQIDLVFRRAGSDLVIEASAGGRASEVRHALPV